MSAQGVPRRAAAPGWRMAECGGAWENRVMSPASKISRWAWPYAAVVIGLTAIGPMVPLGALGGIGSRFHFALALPLALGTVATVAAYRQPALRTAGLVPALAVVANGASAAAYGADGIAEIILATLVLTVVGMVCGAGWRRLDGWKG